MATYATYATTYGTGATWVNWATNSTASSITWSQDLTWNGWVVGNTTTGTTSYITNEELVRLNNAQITWNSIQPFYHPVQQHVYERWQVLHDREVPSPEELQRREDEAQHRREEEARRRLEAEQRWEQEEAERLVAHARGLELLDMILTPEQQAQRREGKIHITGSDGGRWVVDMTYSGVHGNVYEEDAHGCFLGRICIAPHMRVGGRSLPLSDGWVGQILAIQTNEAEFRAVGNWSSRRPCQHPEVPILASVA